MRKNVILFVLLHSKTLFKRFLFAISDYPTFRFIHYRHIFQSHAMGVSDKYEGCSSYLSEFSFSVAMS